MSRHRKGTTRKDSHARVPLTQFTGWPRLPCTAVASATGGIGGRCRSELLRRTDYHREHEGHRGVVRFPGSDLSVDNELDVGPAFCPNDS